MNDWFTITEVQPDVFAISEFKHFQEVSCFLILDGDEAVLFDTGMGFYSMREVVESITSLPVSVFQTHAHWDHIGSSHEFASVSIFADPLEQQRLREGYTADGQTVLGTPNFSTLTDGQMIKRNTFSIQVVHTPGHSPGSVCYLIPEKKLVVAGDLIYKGPIYLFLPESNVGDYIRSVKRLSSLLEAGEYKHLLPGHNTVYESAGLVSEFATALRAVQLVPGKECSFEGFSFKC